LLDPTTWEEGGEPLDTRNNLLDLFNEHFEVVTADTPDRLRECYRLRYEVYCKEGIIPGFPPEDYPDGLEYDHYDERSVHSLLIHKPSLQVAGSVRIILTDRENPGEKLPLEEIAGDSLFRNRIPYEHMLRSRLGEISRLILVPKFRARRGENRKPYGITKNFANPPQANQQHQAEAFRQATYHCENTTQRAFPHAILGLFVAVVQMSFKHDLNYWYGSMETSCARFLRFFGINFIPVSPIINYHGLRQGYFNSVPDIIENIYRTSPQIWALLTNNGRFFPRSK
jgi:N-acyl amino acid synthase of PEP-CTERM/exosortase system